MTTRTADDPIAADAAEKRRAEDLDACLSAQRSGAPPEALVQVFGAEATAHVTLVRRLGWMSSRAYAQPRPSFESKLRARVATEFVASVSGRTTTARSGARHRTLLVVAAAIVLVVGFFVAGVPGRVLGPAATAQAQTGTATVRTPMTQGTGLPSLAPTPVAQMPVCAGSSRDADGVGSSQPEPARTPIAPGARHGRAAPTSVPTRADTLGARSVTSVRCALRWVVDRAAA